MRVWCVLGMVPTMLHLSPQVILIIIPFAGTVPSVKSQRGYVAC